MKIQIESGDVVLLGDGVMLTVTAGSPGALAWAGVDADGERHMFAIDDVVAVNPGKTEQMLEQAHILLRQIRLYHASLTTATSTRRGGLPPVLDGRILNWLQEYSDAFPVKISETLF